MDKSLKRTTKNGPGKKLQQMGAPKPDDESESDEESMFSEAPQILKVQDPPKEKVKPLHPHLPQPPALLLMISPIRTGKSTIINNLLLNSNFFGQDFFDEVMCVSPTIYNDKTSRFLKKAFDCYD